MKYSTINALIADMDGVLWRGNQPLNGIHALFDWLHTRNIPYVLATNNSSRTPEDYVTKLAQMGIKNVPASAIITSSIATATYLQKHYPAGTPVYVLGMHGLRQALTDAGFDVIDDASDQTPQLVVSGIDFELTYDKLKKAAQWILAGAQFFGTNGDLTFPAESGLVPGAGSLLAALQAATGQAPTVIGKPHAPMYEIALQQLGTTPQSTLMLGDRLDTDILGAQQLGLPTALVFTGVTQPDDLMNQSTWADVAYEDLPAFLRAWSGDDWFRDWQKANRQRGLIRS